MRAELEQVYRQHRQTLFSLALTVTGCSALAEDAVHEAFVRLFRQSVRPAGSLVAYVFASVRNAAIDRRRARKKQLTLAESVFAESAGHSAAGTTSDTKAEQLDHLRVLIEALDEWTRVIIVMKTFSDLTFDEIGQVLDVPASTVATRYRRALMKLETQLERTP